MGKSFTIAPKEHNAHLVRGGYFPLPFQRVGPNTWHKIMSADYGVNPIDGTMLSIPTFDQVMELAGDALIYKYNHREDGKSNPVFNPVIGAINDSGKVLTGNTLMVVTPTKAYFVNHPDADLSAQFGVNEQNVLDKKVAEFEKQLKERKERSGIVYAGNVAAISVANVSQGEQSRNPKDANYFGDNKGLIALARGKKVAKGLAVGSNAYKNEPYFGLNGESGKIVTRVPVLYAGGFGGGLVVYSSRNAGGGNGCSFGYSKSGGASAPKK
jgi:hypothetical protein